MRYTGTRSLTLVKVMLLVSFRDDEFFFRFWCSAKKAAVIRASDDFFPRDPASHTIHIASVAYNSIFLGEFMQPDWDMFHVRNHLLKQVLQIHFLCSMHVFKGILTVASLF